LPSKRLPFVPRFAKQSEMARFEEDCSNTLFETLSDWEHILKHSDDDFSGSER
jgi:hypothetical protein